MDIRTRAQWGARYARGFGAAPLPAKYLYLHHTVSPGTGDKAMRTVENIGKERFGGVSYTYTVDADGTVYEGHGIERLGAHTKGLNSTARAISAIGNYDVGQPSPAMLEGIAQLVAHGHREGWWPRALTGGHRDAPGASTACPGRHLYARIPDINRRATEILAGTPTPPPTEEPLMVTEADKAAIRKIVSEEVNRAIGATWVDEASDGREAETARRQYGSLRGWIVALAKKSGVTQADAVAEDPTHRKG